MTYGARLLFLAFLVAGTSPVRAQNLPVATTDDALLIRKYVAATGPESAEFRALAWSLVWYQLKENPWPSGTAGASGRGQSPLSLRKCHPPLTEADTRDPTKLVACTVETLRRSRRVYESGRYSGASWRRLAIAAYATEEGRVNRCYATPTAVGCARDMRGVPGDDLSAGPDVVPLDTRRYVLAIEALFAIAKDGESGAAQLTAMQQKLALREHTIKELEAAATEQGIYLRKLKQECDQLYAARLAPDAGPSTSADRQAMTRVASEIQRLGQHAQQLDGDQSVYVPGVRELLGRLRIANEETNALSARLKEKDEKLARLEAEVGRLQARLDEENRRLVALQARRDNGLSEQERGELTRLQQENTRLTEEIRAFNGRLTDQDLYVKRLLDQLSKAASARSVDLAELARHAIVVMNPPSSLPGGRSLCMGERTIGAADPELLAAGMLLFANFAQNAVDAKGLSDPRFYSYTYRSFSYTTVPIRPLAGTYVGSLASGDAVMLSVDGGPDLREFQTTLRLKTHKGKLEVDPLRSTDQGCPFQNGIVVAFLPYSLGQAFIIARVNNPYEIVGYLLTRADPREQIALLQYRAQRIGR